MRDGYWGLRKAKELPAKARAPYHEWLGISSCHKRVLVGFIVSHFIDKDFKAV